MSHNAAIDFDKPACSASRRYERKRPPSQPGYLSVKDFHHCKYASKSPSRKLAYVNSLQAQNSSRDCHSPVAVSVLHVRMEREKKKTVVCFDALNWMSNIFWNNDAELRFCGNAWEALRYSDRTVGTFVRAARSADYELAVVAFGSSNNPEVRAKVEWRREEEIMHETRGVCYGADMLLAESFQKHGIRVVRPIGADANDVLAALAASVEGAVIVSRNRSFFRYDKVLSVSRDFTVRGGKLLLDRPMTRDDPRCPAMRRSDISFTVQPHLAVAAMSDEGSWTVGHEAKYRPSLRSDGRVERGSTSSTDKRMGNLHTLARPLRAAVYAILGEHSALERIPEWSNDEKMVVWTETEVVADPALSSVLKNPLSVVEWLAEHDTPVAQLEPWRAADRYFNICALAAELVAVSSDGAWTMHKCMELFSNETDIVRRTVPPSSWAETSVEQGVRPHTSQSPRPETSVEQEVRPRTSQDARRHFADKHVFDREQPNFDKPAVQHQNSTPNLLTGITKKKNASSSSRSRESIFGTGRPREEVRGKTYHF